MNKVLQDKMKGVKKHLYYLIPYSPIAMGYTFTNSKLFQITNSYRYQTNRKNQNFYRNTDFFFVCLLLHIPFKLKKTLIYEFIKRFILYQLD